MNKLPNSIFSPILSPTVLDQPACLTISYIPTDYFNGLACRKSLVSWIYLIKSFSVNEEVSVYWNYCNDWSMVEDLLFDIFEFF